MSNNPMSNAKYLKFVYLVFVYLFISPLISLKYIL